MKNLLNEKIIVTGGLGLIGSHLCDILCDEQADVYALDNMYRGKVEYLASPNRVSIMEKDILELTESDAIEGVTSVIHTASKVLGIGYSAKNHQDMMLYNDMMTNSFFNYLDKLPQLERLVIISSSCVYDDELPECSEDKLDIGLPEKANLGYGLAKRFLEHKATLYAKERGVRLTIVRPFNIYGERYTWAGVNSQGLPSLVKKLLDNHGKLEIWGTGAQRRNYMHAYDCAKIIIEIMKKQSEEFGVYNVGIKETVSLKELAEKMCSLYGLTAEFVYRTDMPQGRLEKTSYEDNLLALLPEFKSDLISLDDGLVRMKTWYETNFK